MLARVDASTVRVAVPLMVPEVAVTATAPGATPVAIPLVLTMVALAVSLLDQTTCPVRSLVVLSL